MASYPQSKCNCCFEDWDTVEVLCEYNIWLRGRVESVAPNSGWITVHVYRHGRSYVVKDRSTIRKVHLPYDTHPNY